jgi:DNA-binding Lrp family transcriptional regulator
VLINAEIGAESDVLKGLKDIPEVKESHMVYGVYDIIARIQTDTMQELKDIISWKIRRLDKVRSTLTMIVV